MRAPRVVPLRELACLSLGLVALLWLLDAAGRGLPAAVDRTAVGLAALVVLALLVRTVRRRAGSREGRLLLALVTASTAVHFIGLQHEIGHLYFADEGAFLAQGRRINDGQLVRPWFIYPHLLFYLDAVALWLAGLFEPVVAALARLVYGVEGADAVAVLVTRSVTATLGALTVVPVFAVARRIAGEAAAGLAGTIAVLSPIYVEVAHLNISDVPAAFFATLTLVPVTALLERERARDYVLAGLAAGLAAGSKYPAGLVAVAIAAVWVRWRIRERRLGFGLAWAGLAAVGAFVVATPSLAAFPEKAFGGRDADLLFGFRLYSEAGGWTGIVRASNSLFYAQELLYTFGAPLLVLGLAGLAAWRHPSRARLLWLLPFPALYLALILALKIAVRRNLMPLLPVLAVILGIGLSGWLLWARQRDLWRRWRFAIAGLAVVCLALPAFRTSVQAITFARPTTRELAARWITEHLPPGSFIVQEDYTPRVGPPWRFPSSRPRFVSRFTPDQLRDPRHDFVFLASSAYNRFLDPRNLERDAYEVAAARYREIFDTYQPVRKFAPGRLRGGPVLRLYQVDPEPRVHAAGAVFTAADALLRNPAMRPEDGGPITHTHPVQWSLFKAYLEAGRYRALLDAEMAAGEGRIRVLNRDNEEIDRRSLTPDSTPEAVLPRPDKYFFYVHLPAVSRLRGLTLEKVTGPAAASG